MTDEELGALIDFAGFEKETPESAKDMSQHYVPPKREIEAVLSGEADPDDERLYNLSNGYTLTDYRQADLMRAIMKIDPAKNKMAYPLNAKGMTALMANVLRGSTCYSVDDGSFYRYNGTKWVEDVGGLYTSADIKNVLSLLSQYYPAETGMDEDEQEEYFKYIAKFDSKRIRDATLSDIKDELMVRSDQFDADPYLFNVRNGTIDLRTLKLQPHSPDDYITMVADVDYPTDKKTKFRCERFYKFIYDIMSGDREKAWFLHMALGYSLLGANPEAKMFIAYGKTTRNGKSTLLGTICEIMGDYGQAVNSRFLNQTSTKNDTERATPTLIALKKKRFVVMQESDPHATFDSPTIKMITGGDRLYGRELYRRGETFEVVAKIFYACNHRPRIDDRSLFASERIDEIDFDRHFGETERDTTLKSQFLDYANRPTILWYMLSGYVLYANHRMAKPQVIVDADRDYEMSCFTVERFISTAYERTDSPDDAIPRAELYKAYFDWCTEEDIKGYGRSRFYEEIASMGIQGKVVHGVRMFSGLRKKEERDDG